MSNILDKIRVNAMLAVGRDGSAAMGEGLPWLQNTNAKIVKDPAREAAVREDMEMFRQTMALPSTAYFCGRTTFNTLMGLKSLNIHVESRLYCLSSKVIGNNDPETIVKRAFDDGFTNAWVMGGIQTYRAFSHIIQRSRGRIVMDIIPFHYQDHLHDLNEANALPINFVNVERMFNVDLTHGDEDHD